MRAKYTAILMALMPNTKAYIHANEALAIQPSFSNANGRYRLRCINTARKEYGKVGEKQYRERRQLQCLR